MPMFKLAVFLNPVEDRDAEFNTWYDEHHVPDAMTLPGWKTAQRFKAGPHYMGRDAPGKYMALYDIEAESLEKALEVASEGTARFHVSDAVDIASAHAVPLTPISPVYHSSEEAKAGNKGRQP